MAYKTPLSESELSQVSGGSVTYNGSVLDGSKTIAQLATDLGLTETDAYKKIDSHFLSFTLDQIENFAGTTWTQDWINKNFPTPAEVGMF